MATEVVHEEELKAPEVGEEEIELKAPEVEEEAEEKEEEAEIKSPEFEHEEDITRAFEANAEASLAVDQARKEHEELMNKYVKVGFEKLGEACDNIATPFNTGNIFFGRRKTRVPRDDTFETCTGQKLKREALSQHVQEIVLHAAGETDNDWKPSTKSNGVVVEYSPSRSIPGATFYRAKATLEVPPQHLLLTQIRSSVVGGADESVCYMREHYSFVDGQSFLFHQVRKALPKILGMEIFRLRDFFDFVHWEENDDGTIVYSSQSVDLPANIKDCQRGDNLVFGMIMKPVKLGEEAESAPKEEGEEEDADEEKPAIHTEVTLVTQFRPNGFAPGRLVDAFAPRGIGEYLKNVEKAALKLEEDGETERLIKTYIELEI